MSSAPWTPDHGGHPDGYRPDEYLADEPVPPPPSPAVAGLFQPKGVNLYYTGNLYPGRYDGDAGLDLICSDDTYLTPGRFFRVPSDVRFALPRGYWGLLTGRSSSLAKGIFVPQAVIDEGYRGPMFVTAQYFGEYDGYTVKAGDRIAQLVPMPMTIRELHPHKLTDAEFDALPPTDRGAKGVGSTGA